MQNGAASGASKGLEAFLNAYSDVQKRKAEQAAFALSNKQNSIKNIIELLDRNRIGNLGTNQSQV